MTPAECGIMKMKSHQFIHTCISCKTDQQKSRHHCSVFMGDPIIGLPPAAAQHTVCV